MKKPSDQNCPERRAAEAEKKLEMQAELLATVSHELRTPMGAILNLADILVESELDERPRMYAQTLRNSASGLLRILNDILDHGKLEAGKFELVHSNFSPRELLDNVVETQIIPCRNKGLALRTKIANDLPEQLYGDALRIRQVLLNLVSNAVKFTPSGAVDISVCVAETGKNHRLLEFSVTDTGPGLGEHMKDSLFAPYAQADGLVATRFGGTGLGLSICRQLVLLMGGEIGYNSKPGNGAEFWFNVVCKPGQADGDVTHGAEQGLGCVLALDNQRFGNILIVEDNKTNQLLISTYLEKFGHSFNIVNSGKEALEIITQQNFDAILMDVKMPTMDGVETTRLIRQSKDHTRSIPIIALTANAMSGDKKKYLKAGMDAYVSKPVRPAELFCAIDKILANDRRIAS